MSVTCDRSVVFSGTSVSFTNKTDHHDRTEILLKVALNTINQSINLGSYIISLPKILNVFTSDTLSKAWKAIHMSCFSDFHCKVAGETKMPWVEKNVLWNLPFPLLLFSHSSDLHQLLKLPHLNLLYIFSVRTGKTKIYIN